MMCVLRTTSCSESQNSFFQSFHQPWETLVEFWFKFDTALEKQRYTNEQLNFEGLKSDPQVKTSLPIEKYAAGMYTRAAFYDIQSEIKSSFRKLRILDVSKLEGLNTFVLKDRVRKDRVFEVSIIDSTSLFSAFFPCIVSVFCCCKFIMLPNTIETPL